MTNRPVTLLSREGVDLAHAWVQALAESLHLRVLFIKGPSLHRLGLRDQRSSSDVDVLAAPDDFERLCDAMQRAGWEERDSGLLMRNISHHSRAFVTSTWPCDVDIHSRFPGFLADPGVVFEELWKRRLYLTFADKECVTADRLSSALILALHSLRSVKTQSRHTAELEQLNGAAFTQAELVLLGGLASRTGSAEPLREVLLRMGCALPPSVQSVDAEALRAWRIRTEASEHGLGTYRWLSAFLRAPLSRKAGILHGAVWPSRQDLLVTHPGISTDSKSLNALRRKRLVKGIVGFPLVLRTLWHNRRPT